MPLSRTWKHTKAEAPAWLPLAVSRRAVFKAKSGSLSFFMRIILKVFTELVTTLFLPCVLVALAVRHLGSSLPSQGWNPHPLHWKVKS